MKQKKSETQIATFCVCDEHSTKNKGGFVMHRQHNNEIVLQCLLQPWSVFGATTHRP
jgi:hypothetical protein